MDNRPKVSIIVPVYNGENTIARCIDSILDQSLEEIELIVIDDGSTDATGDICHACDDPRLVYYHKENGGVSSARNMGISMARGQYIGFVDADDYITSDMCEKMYQAGVTSDADICVCDYEIVFGDVKKETYTDMLHGGFFDKQQIRDKVLSRFLGHVDGNGNIAKFDWAIIRRFFKRDFLIQNGLLFDETLSNSEDCLLAYLATHMARSMVYLKDERLYINMRNTQSLTRKYLPDYWQQRCRIIDELETIINTDHPAWETESFPLFVMRCVRPSFTNIAYGFGKVSVLRSIKDFSIIVHDPRVRKMCDVMDGTGLNDEWKKLFDWCKNKNTLTLFLYHKDVYQGDGFCRFIRKVQKHIQRRWSR